MDNTTVLNLTKQEVGFSMPKRYPEGKLTQSDHGELEFRITAVDGRVVMDWGQPVQWVGLTPSEARAIADALVRQAEEAERQLDDL
jgi:hypothetical protein